MTLGLVVARAFHLGEVLMPGLGPRMAQDSYQVLDARQNSTIGNSTGDVVNMFIDSTNSDYEYAASIVTACVDQTVYAIQCTAAPDTVGAETCGPNAAIGTVTSAASFYKGSTITVTEGVTLDVYETCSLAGTTAATCTATAEAQGDGTSTSTSGVETLSGADYYRFNVAITGGAEKTASATATCAARGAAANHNTKKVAIWVLVGVIGCTGIQMML